MQIARLPNGADLAIAKKPGARHRSKDFRESSGIVVGHAEETLTAAVAGENERGKRLTAFETIHPRQLEQIGMGGDLIA